MMALKRRYSWELFVIVSALLLPQDQLKRLPAPANPQLFVAILLPENAALPDPLVKLLVWSLPNLFLSDLVSKAGKQKRSIISMVYAGSF